MFQQVLHLFLVCLLVQSFFFLAHIARKCYSSVWALVFSVFFPNVRDAYVGQWMRIANITARTIYCVCYALSGSSNSKIAGFFCERVPQCDWRSTGKRNCRSSRRLSFGCTHTRSTLNRVRTACVWMRNRALDKFSFNGFKDWKTCLRSDRSGLFSHETWKRWDNSRLHSNWHKRSLATWIVCEVPMIDSYRRVTVCLFSFVSSHKKKWCEDEYIVFTYSGCKYMRGDHSGRNMTADAIKRWR